MNDEIKEILDYLNKFINDREEITKYGCEISVKQANLLLDYITNLQQENKTLHENNQNMQEEIARVWQENERLKDELEWWKQQCDDLEMQVGELDER